MNKVSMKAFIWGSAISIGGSLVAGALIGIAFGIYWAANGTTNTDIATKLVAMPGELSYLLPALAVGLSFTALGGYLAGKLAPAHKVLNAGLTALPCIALGLQGLVSNWSVGTPLWYHVASYILVIPVAALGGFVASRRPTSVADDRAATGPVLRR